MVLVIQQRPAGTFWFEFSLSNCIESTELSEQFIIAQKIRSSLILFLDPVVKFFLMYVRKLFPKLYPLHFLVSAERTFK
jgi:hypothetical protein